MGRLIQAWGGTLLGTIVGLCNAIVVTRSWDSSDAADFFLVPVIVLAAATIAEFGLGALSVHDVARTNDRNQQQAYVNAALAIMATRSIIPALVTTSVAAFALDLAALPAVGVGIATTATTVALAGQPLLRGLDRRGLASVAGPIAATILTGVIVIPMSVVASDVAPVLGALVGYTLAGVLTVAALVRRTDGTAHDGALLTLRRSRYVAGHNVANMAGRQVDSILAGSFMSDRLFTSYSVTIRMAAPLGLIAYAANQATARDMHRIVDGDPSATSRAAAVYRWALAGAVLAAIGLVAVGPPIGSFVFGSSIEIRRDYLVVIGAAYLVSVAGAAGDMLLAAAERTDELLRASMIALACSAVFAVVAIVVGESVWAAPVFVATWLTVSTTLNARAVHKALGLSVWAVGFGARNSD